MRSLVLRTDHCGAEWVVLQEYYNWDEQPTPDQDPYDRPRRDLWSHIYSWVVRRGDAPSLYHALSTRTLMGRWMPEGGDVTDAAYLPEMPWAESANAHPRGWDTATFSESRELPGIEVQPTWVGYLWEGNVWDCSIDDAVSATLSGSGAVHFRSSAMDARHP